MLTAAVHVEFGVKLPLMVVEKSWERFESGSYYQTRSSERQMIGLILPIKICLPDSISTCQL